MTRGPQSAEDAQVSANKGRVLILAPQPFYDDRGTPIAVRFVIEALSEIGYTIDLVTLPLGTEINVRGLTIHRLKNPFGVRSVPIGFSLAKLFFAGLMLIDVAIRIRRYDYVCVHAVEEAALTTALCSRRSRPPMIYDMASSLPEQLKSHKLLKRLPLGRLFELTETLMFRRASAIVASAGLDVEPGKTIPEANRFVWQFPALEIAEPENGARAMRAQLELPENARIILYTGNFASYQGVDLLLNAFPAIISEVPEAVLVMVGAQDGEEIAEVKSRLNGELERHVYCVERESRSRMGRFLAAAEVLVSPRAYGGNFPLKIFDYLAAGKPIVATDIPAHTCVLNHDLAELTAADAISFGKGVISVLESEERASALATAATRYADQHLRWKSFVDLVDRLYERAYDTQPAHLADSRGKQNIKPADQLR